MDQRVFTTNLAFTPSNILDFRQLEGGDPFLMESSLFPTIFAED